MMGLRRIAVIILFALWILTGGIHFGASTALFFLSIAACFTVIFLPKRHAFLSPNDVKDDYFQSFKNIGAFGYLLLGMIALTLLSLIPMPLFILDVLSPTAADWYRESWALADVSRNWGCLSVALARSSYALMHLCTFFAVYIFALWTHDKRSSLKELSRTLIAVGCLWTLFLALNAAGQPLSWGYTGAQSLFHIGLPLNANHTSAVFVILSLMSLGSLLQRRHRDIFARNALWGLFYLIFSAMVIHLQSRGAIFAWICAHILLLTIRMAAKQQCSAKTAAVIGIAFALTIGTVASFSAPTLTAIHAEWSNTTLIPTPDEKNTTFSKTRLYPDILNMTADWKIFGFGRSAFADVFPAYQSFPFHKRFRHAENEYLEWIAEFGIPFGAFFIILFAIAFVLHFRSLCRSEHERTVMLGLYCGLFAVALQNLFDFNLRYLTSGFLFWFLCGCLQARALHRQIRQCGGAITATTRQRRCQNAGFMLFFCASAVAIATLPLAEEGERERELLSLPSSIKTASDSTNTITRQLALRTASAPLRLTIGATLVNIAESLPEPQKEKTWKKALPWLTSAHRHDPYNAEIAMRLAKLQQALGNTHDATQSYLRAARNDARKITPIASQLARLPFHPNDLPNDNERLTHALISALIQHQRFDDALSLSQKISDDDLRTEAQIDIYRALGLDDAVPLLLDASRSSPLTLRRLQLITDECVREKNFEDLLLQLEKTEHLFASLPEYWRLRMYKTIWYGMSRGKEWYEKNVPKIVFRFRQFAPKSRTYAFDDALCDAKFALELERFQHARRSAQRALLLNPKSKQAQDILQKSTQKLRKIQSDTE